jgi:glycosyltransferase involved in cell wall biosynthesis
MNIIFLSRLFYPHIGGVEKHVFEISRRLVQQGHSITIISEKTDDSLDNMTREQRLVLKNVTLYYIPVKEGKRKKFIVWSWMRKHKKFCWRQISFTVMMFFSGCFHTAYCIHLKKSLLHSMVMKVIPYKKKQS